MAVRVRAGGKAWALGGLGPGGSGDQLNNQYWLMAGGVCYVQICRRGSQKIALSDVRR